MKKILFVICLLFGGVAYGQLAKINVGTGAVNSGEVLKTAFPKINLAIDTINKHTIQIPLRLKIADTATMLTPYGTVVNLAKKLNISDTASMLTPYVNRNDYPFGYLDPTSSIQGQFIAITTDLGDYVAGVAVSDTAAMLSKYSRKTDNIFSLTELAANPTDRNIYINSVDKKIHYLSGGYWHRIAILDSTLDVDGLLRDGNTVGWYISDSTSTITKDGSNLVAQWRDYLASGNNLATPTADAWFKPTWSATGITFDGVDNFVTGAFTLAQPVFIYAVVKVFSGSTEWGSLFAGNVTTSTLVSAHGLGTTPKIFMVAGGAGLDNANLTTNAFFILRVLFSGTSSKSIINATSPATGSTVGTGGMGGFSIGAQLAYGTPSHIQVKEVIVRKVSEASTNDAAIYAYLKAKYGL